MCPQRAESRTTRFWTLPGARQRRLASESSGNWCRNEASHNSHQKEDIFLIDRNTKRFGCHAALKSSDRVFGKNIDTATYPFYWTTAPFQDQGRLQSRKVVATQAWWFQACTCGTSNQRIQSQQKHSLPQFHWKGFPWKLDHRGSFFLHNQEIFSFPAAKADRNCERLAWFPQLMSFRSRDLYINPVFTSASYSFSISPESWSSSKSIIGAKRTFFARASFNFFSILKVSFLFRFLIIGRKWLFNIIVNCDDSWNSLPMSSKYPSVLTW